METSRVSPRQKTGRRNRRETFIDARLEHIKTLPLLAALEREVHGEIAAQYALRHSTKVQRTRREARLEVKRLSMLLVRIQVISPVYVDQALQEQAYLNLPEHERVDTTRYRYLCSFRLTAGELSKVKGYDLLVKHGWYNAKSNPAGVVRDHRFSINMGWKLKVNPEIMSHPANCEFLLNADNIRKSDSCSLTLLELKTLIGD